MSFTFFDDDKARDRMRVLNCFYRGDKEPDLNISTIGWKIMNSVMINDIPLIACEFNGERVVTFQQVAVVHGVPLTTIRDSYTRNSSYFIDGEDTYVIDFDKKTAFPFFDIPTRGLRVFTESGYLMLVKPLRDETAREEMKS